MGDQSACEMLSDGQVGDGGRGDPSIRAPPFSKLGAVMRIRNKYQALKRRRMEQAGTQSAGEIFTFDAAVQPGGKAEAYLAQQKKKKRKSSRVLFPSDGRKFLPAAERSRAKPFLFLLSSVLFLQVYNAIENLDDHLLRYDLEGLERMLRREVFGQAEATAQITLHLREYLSTYAHHEPLAISLHGPAGVGKSHLGRILARHFRSVVGEQLVVQYFATHHCPPAVDPGDCARDLLALVSAAVTQAEVEEKIPLLIFDEVEFMSGWLLDTLHGLLRPEQANEYLNAVYILISSLGEEQITNHVLRNSSSSSSERGSGRSLQQEVGPHLSHALQKLHPLWAEVEMVPLTLLEKSHVIQCFLEEMSQEGLYPERPLVEQLAAELTYHSAGDLQYSHSGCKQVVAKVNLL
ncbi:hypothetical protein GJAV_G00032990 [Gymnothorax javanicus]|nr:hypothetical protein GJAV_G00032990 [Gymnothorax javanicus]